MNQASEDLEEYEDDEEVALNKKAGSLLRMWITIGALSFYQFVLATLNEESPSGTWALLSFAGYLAFLYRIAYDAPAATITSLPFLFFSAAAVGACSTIECGAWMEEIAQVGHPTGGTARLAISQMIFCGVAAQLMEPIWRRKQEVSFRDAIEASVSKLSLLITLGCVLSCAYLTFVGLRKGFPFFTGTDRYVYKFELSDPIFASVAGNYPVYAIGTSLLASVRRTRFLGWALFIAMFLLQMLYGEKLGLLMVLTAIFATTMCLLSLDEHKMLPITRIAVIGGTVSGLTLILCLNWYAYAHGGGFDIGKQKLMERMAEQGEMWYVGDRDFGTNTHIDWPIVWKEVTACLGLRSQNAEVIGTDFGPFIVMEHYGTERQLRNALERQVYFVSTYSTYWMMISGYFGFSIVWFLTSVTYGLSGRLFLDAMRKGNILGILLGQKALLMAYAATNQGWTHLALGYKIFLVLGAGWFVVNWRRFLRN